MTFIRPAGPYRACLPPPNTVKHSNRREAYLAVVFNVNIKCSHCTMDHIYIIILFAISCNNPNVTVITYHHPNSYRYRYRRQISSGHFPLDQACRLYQYKQYERIFEQSRWVTLSAELGDADYNDRDLISDSSLSQHLNQVSQHDNQSQLRDCQVIGSDQYGSVI